MGTQGIVYIGILDGVLSYPKNKAKALDSLLFIDR